jgi:hypothetical protein
VRVTQVTMKCSMLFGPVAFFGVAYSSRPAGAPGVLWGGQYRGHQLCWDRWGWAGAVLYGSRRTALAVRRHRCVPAAATAGRSVLERGVL